METEASRNGGGVGSKAVLPECVANLLEPIGQMPLEFNNERMPGPWLKESDSAAEFDRRVARSGLFHSVGECEGRYRSLKLIRGKQSNLCRIDRLLIPTQKLLDSGWMHGPVGVEIEASQQKVGNAICQALDYKGAVFTPRGKPGFWYDLEWIALWPWPGSMGALAKIACQNKICGAYFGPRSIFFLSDGIKKAVVCDNDMAVKVNNFNCGDRTGHRSGV